MMKSLGIVLFLVASLAAAMPPDATMHVPPPLNGSEKPVVLAIDGATVTPAESYKLRSGAKHTIKLRCGASGPQELIRSAPVLAGQQLEVRCTTGHIPNGRLWVIPAGRPNNSFKPTPLRGAA